MPSTKVVFGKDGAVIDPCTECEKTPAKAKTAAKATKLSKGTVSKPTKPKPKPKRTALERAQDAAAAKLVKLRAAAETSRKARARVLQGQEARAAHEALQTATATPEDLEKFVSRGEDRALSEPQKTVLLTARLAQRSAKKAAETVERKTAERHTEVQKAAQDALDEASRVGAVAVAQRQDLADVAERGAEQRQRAATIQRDALALFDQTQRQDLADAAERGAEQRQRAAEIQRDAIALFDQTQRGELAEKAETQREAIAALAHAQQGTMAQDAEARFARLSERLERATGAEAIADARADLAGFAQETAAALEAARQERVDHAERAAERTDIEATRTRVALENAERRLAETAEQARVVAGARARADTRVQLAAANERAAIAEAAQRSRTTIADEARNRERIAVAVATLRNAQRTNEHAAAMRELEALAGQTAPVVEDPVLLEVPLVNAPAEATFADDGGFGDLAAGFEGMGDELAEQLERLPGLVDRRTARGLGPVEMRQGTTRARAQALDLAAAGSQAAMDALARIPQADRQRIINAQSAQGATLRLSPAGQRAAHQFLDAIEADDGPGGQLAAHNAFAAVPGLHRISEQRGSGLSRSMGSGWRAVAKHAMHLAERGDKAGAAKTLMAMRHGEGGIPLDKLEEVLAYVESRP